MSKFGHLDVPDQWGQYFTKYPQGYTILEALLNWVQQVDDMTDNVNTWNDYLDSFVLTFDTDLQEKVKAVLLAWELDGTLTDIINQATTGFFNVKQYGVVGNGVAGDSDTIQAMITTQRGLIRSGGLQSSITVNVPAGTYIIDKPIKTYYTKFKAQGLVRFILTFNGSAFWVAPEADDTKYDNSVQPLEMGKNIWTHGKLFDGSNGSFVFVTTLDKTTTGNDTTAIELGDRDTGADARNPVSRFEVDNVNVFGLNAAIKGNGVNMYLAHFEHCHWEMNNHAFWWYTSQAGKVFNAGENITFYKCIIAGSVKESFRIEAPAFDASVLHCSFDYNASPIFKYKASGISVRFSDNYIEKIGDGTGNQLILQSAAQLAGEANGRSSFYIKNLITYLKRPTKLFENLPNGTGDYINVFLDIDGMETRFDTADPYDITNRFMLSDTEHFRLLRHRVHHGTTVCKNLVSKQLNLLQNGDFSLSTLNTELNMNNTAADSYWASSYHDSSIGPKIADGGVGGTGSNCLKYDIVRTTNTLSVYYKDYVPVEAGEVLQMGALYRVDKISSRNDIKYRFEWYDTKKVLVSTTDYTDIFTDSSTILTVDGANYRSSRTHGVVYAPAAAAFVKVYVILGNLDVTSVYIDNIHLSKSK
jgi:hypothetical protein